MVTLLDSCTYEINMSCSFEQLIIHDKNRHSDQYSNAIQYNAKNGLFTCLVRELLS